MVFRYLITVFSCIRHHRNLNQFILTFLSEKIDGRVIRGY
ncbi:hypothetical protein LTSEMIN_0077, partial [Salmonella enterica subsp. enterica serovar Minnesota str. A4-603]